MGYRSSVRVITSKKGFEKLNDFSKDYLSKKNGEDFNLMDSFDIKCEDNKCCYFGWDWVKWYEGSYDEVDAIMEGLDYLEQNDYSYRFSRIGESFDDYDERYYDSETENENESDLEYIPLIRDFDDEQMLHTLIQNVQSDKEIEI